MSGIDFIAAIKDIYLQLVCVDLRLNNYENEN